MERPAWCAPPWFRESAGQGESQANGGHPPFAARPAMLREHRNSPIVEEFPPLLLSSRVHVRKH
eukprot:4696231-Alexandrium_andersonii.AAC.1